MSLERFRKSPCTSLSVRVIQREVTFQKLLMPISENPRHTTDQGVEVVGKELQYVQVCSQKKPVNLNLLIGVERVRSESEEPPNSSESLPTTKRPGREFY